MKTSDQPVGLNLSVMDFTRIRVELHPDREQLGSVTFQRTITCTDSRDVCFLLKQRGGKVLPCHPDCLTSHNLEYVDWIFDHQVEFTNYCAKTRTSIEVIIEP